jgi:hypothetical protein
MYTSAKKGERMKENRTAMIVLGCIGALCLCGAVVAVLGAGFYIYGGAPWDAAAVQATISPENIPTRLPAMTPTGSALPSGMSEELPDAAIDDLARIAVLPFSYDENDDGIDEGVAIDLVFYDAHDEVISFEGTPIKITMEFYAFTDFLNASDISAGDLVYSETVTRDHSSTLDEMFDNYIRIPYDKMNVDPNKYIRFGMVRVVVDAPSGFYEITSMLVTLYPEP